MSPTQLTGTSPVAVPGHSRFPRLAWGLGIAAAVWEWRRRTAERQAGAWDLPTVPADRRPLFVQRNVRGSA